MFLFPLYVLPVEMLPADSGGIGQSLDFQDHVPRPHSDGLRPVEILRSLRPQDATVA